MKYKIEIETYGTYSPEIIDLYDDVDVENFTIDDVYEIIGEYGPGDFLFNLGIPLDYFDELGGKFHLKVTDESGNIICKEDDIFKFIPDCDYVDDEIEFDAAIEAHYKKIGEKYDYEPIEESEYCVVMSNRDKWGMATYYVDLDEPFDMTKLWFAEMREYDELQFMTSWYSPMYLFYDKEYLEPIEEGDDGIMYPEYFGDSILLCKKIGEGYCRTNLRELRALGQDDEYDDDEEYDDDDCAETIKLNEGGSEVSQPRAEHLFYTKGRDYDAKGFYSSDGFTVLKGSVVAPMEKGDDKRKTKLEDCTTLENEKRITTSDKTFSSPSAASSFCSGNSVNGWVAWKDEDGNTLDSIYRK